MLCRALIEHASDLVVIIDRQWTVHFCSPSVTQILGYQPEELVGRTVATLLHPTDLPAARTAFALLLAGAGQSMTQTRVQHKNGEWRLLEGIAKILPVDFAAAGIIINARDITVRQDAEHALRESEQCFRAVFEQAAVGMAHIALDSHFVRVNDKFCAILGYTRPELLDRNCYEITYPDDQHKSRELNRQLLAGERESFATEKRYLRKDGTTVWVHLTASSLRDANGRVQYGMAVIEDITDQKRMAEQIRFHASLLDQVYNGVVATDAADIIIYWNKYAETLYQWTADEAIGQSIALIQPTELQHMAPGIFATVQADGVWAGDAPVCRKDGVSFPVHLVLTQLHDANGVLIGRVGVATDITEHRQFEREREAIATVSAALRVALTRAEMLPVILEQLMDLLQAQGGFVVMRDPSSGGGRFELACGASAPVQGLVIPPGTGIANHVMDSKQVYTCDDVRTDPNLYRTDLLGPLRAMAYAPLIANTVTIGTIGIGRNVLESGALPPPFTKSEIRLLSAVADITANAIHRASLYEQTELRLQRLSALRAIDQAIVGSLDLRVTLNILLDQVTGRLQTDAAAVLLCNAHSQSLEYAAGRGFRSLHIEHSRIRMGEGITGQAALERRTVQTNDITNSDTPFVRTRLLADEGFASYCCVPLIAKGQVKGVLELFHRTPLFPDHEWFEFLEALGGQAAIAIETSTLFNDLQRSNMKLLLAYDTTLEGWSRALDLRDHVTDGHSQRVAELTVRLAVAYGLSDYEVMHARRGALLHDIGKMAIPDDVLHKPGPFTEAEQIIMRKHPLFAFEMLASIAYLRPALDIPYAHHEKWDGTGYPRGLHGKQIPVAARIFALIDVWDALISDRPYRRAWSEDEALAYIREQAGKHFDPQITTLFLEVIRRPHTGE
jgi:PAS domain S-box-containing protein/putative nucleotidyltransferase with HDIG domain